MTEDKTKIEQPTEQITKEPTESIIKIKKP